MNLRYWHVLVITLLTIPLLMHANDRATLTMSPKFEKIYVTPDEILLTPEGIFYLGVTGAEPVRILASDSLGIYIIGEVYRCPGCNRINRGVCTNPSCSMYGRLLNIRD